MYTTYCILSHTDCAHLIQKLILSHLFDVAPIDPLSLPYWPEMASYNHFPPQMTSHAGLKLLAVSRMMGLRYHTIISAASLACLPGFGFAAFILLPTFCDSARCTAYLPPPTWSAE